MNKDAFEFSINQDFWPFAKKFCSWPKVLLTIKKEKKKKNGIRLRPINAACAQRKAVLTSQFFAVQLQFNRCQDNFIEYEYFIPVRQTDELRHKIKSTYKD